MYITEYSENILSDIYERDSFSAFLHNKNHRSVNHINEFINSVELFIVIFVLNN